MHESYSDLSYPNTFLTRGGNKKSQKSLETTQETTVFEVRKFNSSSHSFQNRNGIYIVEKETTPLIKTATTSLRLDGS